MTLEGMQAFTASRTPDFRCFVPTATGDALPVRTVGYRENPVLMTLEGMQAFAAVSTPDFRCFVPTATGDALPVRTVGYRENPVLMTLEGMQALAAGCSPDFERIVITAAGRCVARPDCRLPIEPRFDDLGGYASTRRWLLSRF